MARASLRDKILTTGLAFLHQRGYGAAGVREITRAAGVPLGSFSNHFRSKEAFALEVLDRYLAALKAIMETTLLDNSRQPLDRIHAYFVAIEELLAPVGWRYGCMVANLGLEVPEHSEPMRARLIDAFAELTEPFAVAVRAAQAQHSIRGDLDAHDLAAFILGGWHGALLRMKVERSAQPLARFKRVLFTLLGSSGHPGEAP